MKFGFVYLEGLCSFCRIHILDCYTDPLGWKEKIRKSGNVSDPSNQILLPTSSYKTVKDMDKLFSVITEVGRGITIMVTLFFN